jgi:anaerobic selenocysteine-containing dehydrogenase
MHPSDMSERAINDRDKVRIFNERGELHLPAVPDSGLKPGCISITNGWWITEGGTVNFCSPALETDMGYGAAFHDNRVQVESLI